MQTEQERSGTEKEDFLETRLMGVWRPVIAQWAPQVCSMRTLAQQREEYGIAIWGTALHPPSRDRRLDRHPNEPGAPRYLSPPRAKMIAATPS